MVAGQKPAKSRHCSLPAKAYDLIMGRPAEVRLARFPLSEAFTARNIINHPGVGPGYQRASEGQYPSLFTIQQLDCA